MKLTPTIFIFFGCVWILSCAERDLPPTLEEQLHGMWVRDWIDFDTNINFHAGACDVCASGINPPICHNYAYYTNANTLTLVDLVSREKLVYLVSFPTDSTAVFDWSGGVRYFLKRI